MNTTGKRQQAERGGGAGLFREALECLEVYLRGFPLRFPAKARAVGGGFVEETAVLQQEPVAGYTPFKVCAHPRQSGVVAGECAVCHFVPFAVGIARPLVGENHTARVDACLWPETFQK